ncbi:MAG: GNAT family N-acetyltransferase [Chloroflexota bacterium]
MTKLISQPYAGQQDLVAMTNVIRSRPPERLDDFPGILDLEAWTADKEPARQLALWRTEDGVMIGYSIVDSKFNSLWFETIQMNGVIDLEQTAIEKEMLRWGEKSLIEAVQEKRNSPDTGPHEDEEISICVSCRDNFFDRIFLLETEKFEAGTGYTVHLVRPLAKPIPVPQTPLGYVIRPVAESEVEASVALHRAAFGTENMTVEGRRSWMTTTDYEPALDLVAVAPDGTLAAYCFCTVSQADNELTGRKRGWTDPVATHPNHQRKGLATALMLTGAAMLKERGMEEAALGTWSENEAMRNAAEKAGYGVRGKTLFYYKGLGIEE